MAVTQGSAAEEIRPPRKLQPVSAASNVTALSGELLPTLTATRARGKYLATAKTDETQAVSDPTSILGDQS